MGQQYANCRIEHSTNGTVCSTRSSSPLIRDDLMAATVDATRAVFPLNITMFNAEMTFLESSQPEKWQSPLLLSFSEVDFDDEDSAALPFWGFCILVALGTCCLVTCCCWAWCICCKGTMCCRSRPTSDGIEERTNSKELDVEAQQYLSGVPVQVMSEQHYTFDGDILAAPPIMGIPVSDTSKDLPCHDMEKVELELKPENKSTP